MKISKPGQRPTCYNDNYDLSDEMIKWSIDWNYYDDISDDDDEQLVWDMKISRRLARDQLAIMTKMAHMMIQVIKW